MSTVVSAIFTKLIVNDEEKMAEYYTKVYDMKPTMRFADDNAVEGEAYREVILTVGEEMGSGTLVMLKLVDRPKPRDQQVVLGFLTPDLAALKNRIVEHGGCLVGPTREDRDFGARVQYSEDPEGSLAENIQLIQLPPQ